jgi:hypothetical protein
MPYRTGVTAHDAAIYAAEMARQISQAPGASAAVVRAADIVYARAVKASCIANNNSSGVEQVAVMLRELGTGGG